MNKDNQSDYHGINLIDSNNFLLGIQLRNNRDKLSKICSLLEINDNILSMLKDSYTIEAINNKERAFEGAERITRHLTASICDPASHSNTKFKRKIMEKEINYNPDIKTLVSNAIQLIFFGN